MKKTPTPPNQVAGQNAPKDAPPTPKKRKEGRPPQLTEEVYKVMVAARRRGMPETLLGPLCGLSESIVGKWKDRGEREKSGIYFEFFEALKAARPKFILSNLEIIYAARSRSWQAAKDLLVMTEPEMFGRSHVRLGGDEAAPPVKTTRAKPSDLKDRAMRAKRVLDALKD